MKLLLDRGASPAPQALTSASFRGDAAIVGSWACLGPGTPVRPQLPPCPQCRECLEAIAAAQPVPPLRNALLNLSGSRPGECRSGERRGNRPRRGH